MKTNKNKYGKEKVENFKQLLNNDAYFDHLATHGGISDV